MVWFDGLGITQIWKNRHLQLFLNSTLPYKPLVVQGYKYHVTVFNFTLMMTAAFITLKLGQFLFIWDTSTNYPAT